MTDKEGLFDDLNSLFDSFLDSKGIDLETSKLTTNRFNSIMMYLYNTYVCKLEITNNRGIKQYSYIDFINLVEWYISKCLYLDLITLYGFCLLINRSMGFLNGLKYADDIEIQSNFIFDIDCNTNNSSVLDTNNNCVSSDIDNICNINTLNGSVVDNSIYNSDSVENNNNIYNGVELDNNIYSDSGLEGATIEGEKASALCRHSVQKLYETLTQSTVNKLNDSTIGLIANANNNKDIGLMYAKERIEMQAKARQTIALSDLPLLE